MTKPPANVLDLPPEERAEMAMKAAVEKIILEAAREAMADNMQHVDAKQPNDDHSPQVRISALLSPIPDTSR